MPMVLVGGIGRDNNGSSLIMQSLFLFLNHNAYFLLFLVVALAVLIGRFKIKGYGLGMVAGAIVVGCALSMLSSSYGVALSLDSFTKSLFYYLFMYGVGLRVGPSFLNSLRGDGLNFTLLAVVSCVIGLLIIVMMCRWLNLPSGAAGGILAGSMTMSAALGSAEQAVTDGVVTLTQGTTPQDVSSMIALCYGITYIWGTVGIVIICKYLPKWWGIDARQAAKDYEKEHGVRDLDGESISGYLAFSFRAYRLTNPATAEKSIHAFRQQYPEYRIINISRNGTSLGAEPDLQLQLGDEIALGGSRKSLTESMGCIGPEIDAPDTLGVALEQAEILVTQKTVMGKTLETLNHDDLAGQIQLTQMERNGLPYPIADKTCLQKRDILSVVGLKPAVEKAGELIGKTIYPSTTTDLLTLSVGMMIGLLIGLIEIQAFGAHVGLGNAGGLLVSGVLVSSISSRLRFFGHTPNAARNILEDIGLIVFVSIVGINAGTGLLDNLTGLLALKIFVIGFFACTIPPFIVWAIGYHIMKINPAVLMGAIAGARSHSGPCREAAKEIDSTVPWIGFPVGYAIAGILLTVFGYFSMVLAGI